MYKKIKIVLFILAILTCLNIGSFHEAHISASNYNVVKKVTPSKQSDQYNIYYYYFKEDLNYVTHCFKSFIKKVFISFGGIVVKDIFNVAPSLISISIPIGCIYIYQKNKEKEIVNNINMFLYRMNFFNIKLLYYSSYERKCEILVQYISYLNNFITMFLKKNKGFSNRKLLKYTNRYFYDGYNYLKRIGILDNPKYKGIYSNLKNIKKYLSSEQQSRYIETNNVLLRNLFIVNIKNCKNLSGNVHIGNRYAYLDIYSE